MSVSTSNNSCTNVANVDAAVSDNEFPLFSIDENLFLNGSAEKQIDLGTIPYNKSFNPNEITQNNIPDNDKIDPDVNYNLTYVNSSNFYSLSEFNDKTDSLNLSGNELSLFHLNVRSIRHKFDTLLEYLSSLKHRFSVIALVK